MPRQQGPVAAVVLAAGCSSRMGRPKALLPLGPGTCLGLVIAACREARVAPIHVVVGFRGGSVAAAASREGAAAVWNDLYPLGQVTSLQAGIRSLPDAVGGAVLFPVDHAAVSPETLGRLVEAFRFEKEGKRVFVPARQGEIGRPYLIDRLLFSELLSIPPGSPGRLVLLGDPTRVRRVRVDDPGILTDLDTPADYLTLRNLFRVNRSG